MISRYIYKVLLLYLIKLITEFAQPASNNRQIINIVSGSAYSYPVIGGAVQLPYYA